MAVGAGIRPDVVQAMQLSVYEVRYWIWQMFVRAGGRPRGLAQHALTSRLRLLGDPSAADPSGRVSNPSVLGVAQADAVKGPKGL